MERITDARRIRALAHPLRVELLELLADRDLTATECAELTGESVASCAFHLHSLAKYGWVEPAERRGREKPWHLVTSSYDIRPIPGDLESLRALEATGAIMAEQGLEHVRSWVAHVTSEQPEWLDASTMTSSTGWLTVDELATVSHALQHQLSAFRDRDGDPARRPPGARAVRLFAVASPDVDREARAAASSPADAS